MQVRFRKTRSNFHRFHEVYEWRPLENRDERYYQIHRRDILFLAGVSDRQRHIMNEALNGGTIVRAWYFRVSYGRTLVIE